MEPSQSDRARTLSGVARATGRFRHAQSVGRRHARAFWPALGFEALATTSAGLAFALGRRDGEGAVSRDEALAHAARHRRRDAAAGLGGSGERLRRRARRRRPRPSVWRPTAGLVGASIEDATGDSGAPDLRRLARGRSASRRRSKPPARCPSRSRSPRAPRTSCMAAPISTTPSAGCRRSKPRAPTCSTRRGCAI